MKLLSTFNALSKEILVIVSKDMSVKTKNHQRVAQFTKNDHSKRSLRMNFDKFE